LVNVLPLTYAFVFLCAGLQGRSVTTKANQNRTV
jgi:hypothetical protein